MSTPRDHCDGSWSSAWHEMQTNGTTNPTNGCGNQRHCNPAAGPEMLQPRKQKTWHNLARITGLGEHSGSAMYFTCANSDAMVAGATDPMSLEPVLLW